MFKNIKTQIAAALCTALLLSSCLEDEGNYVYTDINEVSLTGLEESYEILRFEDFNLKPELSFTQDSDTAGRYEYKWQAYATSQGVPSTDPDKFTDLSTEKDLTVRATIPTGNYTIYYTVIDTVTKQEWQFDVAVDVISSTYEGWFVLNDVGGESRLDMIPLEQGVFEPIHDVLDFVDSDLKLTGEPSFLTFAAYSRTLPSVIYVSTSGNGTTKFNADTFEWDSNYDLSKEFGSTMPDGLEAQAVEMKPTLKQFAVVDGDLYFAEPWRYTLFTLPINIVDGVKVDVSPMFTIGGNFSYSVFYDTTNLRFIVNAGGDSSITLYDSNNTLFDYSNVGKELVYLGSNRFGGANNTATFAVLKDTDGAKQYLAYFNGYNWKQEIYEEILATDFDKAENIAVSPEFGYIFYSVGSKVYEYDIYTHKTFEMLDKGSQEITMLKFHTFLLKGNYETRGNDLIVCTADPSKPEGSNGTMEIYDVIQANQQIQLLESYDGFGKIKSVTYLER